MHINWKKTIIVMLDVVLGVYVAVAMTSLNGAGTATSVCTKVAIDISDGNINGFLSSNEIKSILQRNDLYPLARKMDDIDPRRIEQLLKGSPFVKTAECFKTVDGHVNIVVTQRMPIVRIKSDNSGDYYLDEKGGIMPNSKYTSDLIIATGHISKSFATNYVAFLSGALMANDMWRNLVEQINVLPDQSIEIVPRVGNHIVNIGYLPAHRSREERQDSIVSYVNRQMSRLEKFYKYGLSQAGWNKYSYIDLEFDNQIICKKRPELQTLAAQPSTPPAQDEVPQEGTAESIQKEKTVQEKPQQAQPSTGKPSITANDKEKKQHKN